MTSPIYSLFFVPPPASNGRMDEGRQTGAEPLEFTWPVGSSSHPPPVSLAPGRTTRRVSTLPTHTTRFCARLPGNLSYLGTLPKLTRPVSTCGGAWCNLLRCDASSSYLAFPFFGLAWQIVCICTTLATLLLPRY